MATVAGGKKVTFPSENPAGDGQGVMFGNPSETPKAVIVIHEWWGMNQGIQQQACAIAKDGGFTTLIIDCYRGNVADDREKAGHLMGGLNWDGAVQDIAAGAKFLLSQGCTKVGVTGFCLGGALSFLAGFIPDVSAIAPFYGIPKQGRDTLTQIKIPIQAHFGLKDEVKGFSSAAESLPLKEELEAAGCDVDFRTYDAGHAFTNKTMPEKYNKEAAEKALAATYKFLHQKLM